MQKPLKVVETETLRKILPEAFFAEKTGEARFLTGPQADAILTMQLQRLTGLEIEKLATEYAELMEKIEEYRAILSNNETLLDIIREDIYEIKEKYGDKRRTQIVEQVEDFDIEDLIADEKVVVTLSHSGYIKRMPTGTYKTQARGGRGIIGSDTSEGDFIEHLFTASTHDYLLIFTNRGKCHWLKVYNIPSLTRQSKGRNIVNLLSLGDEKITSVINVTGLISETEDSPRQLVMATKNGVVKKTSLSSYSNPRTNGVIAIKIDEDDALIGVALTCGEDQIILGTKNGMAIRFDEKQARSMGRVSRGVRGIKLRQGDEVVDMVIPTSDSSLLTVCEKGYGKRTDLDDYRIQSRGGLGLINIKTSERNGKVVAMKAVHDDDELMLITANGIIIRTGLDQLRSIGRNTQGVRLINLKGDDLLVAAEKLAPEDDEEEGEVTTVTERQPRVAVEPEIEAEDEGETEEYSDETELDQ